MHENSQRLSELSAELPLMLFLRIADGDGLMTANEMARFDELLRNRDWCHSSIVESGLAQLETRKAKLWKRYIASELVCDPITVEAAVDELNSLAPERELADIQRDLSLFCSELVKAANDRSFFSKDRQAEAAGRSLQDLIRRPSRRNASKSNIAAGPAATEQASVAAVDCPIWNGGQVRLMCLNVVQETHDVRTFVFAADPPQVFSYRAGQFVTLEIPLVGETLRRSYTISSSPSRPLTLSITVKRIPDGVISNWLHDHMSPGLSLAASGPAGKFSCHDEAASCYLFVSGGSGITPVMSMARWLADLKPSSDIVFLHFARTPDDLIFSDELALLQRNLPNCRVEYVVSNASAHPEWTGRAGRIAPNLLREAVPDFHNRSVYLCGPVPFMQAAKKIFEDLSFDMSRFSQESFGGAPPKATITGPAAATRIAFVTSNVEAHCTTGDYILDKALESGLTVTYSCRSGQCGSCKAKLLSGRVEHDCADGLSPADIEDGLILICQARPVDPVVVEL